MAIALVALGSNLGDRASTLGEAVHALRLLDQVELRAVSRWHATRPVGGPSGQAEFFNGAVLLETSLAPHQLLARLQSIEQAAQRKREVHWGPRTLDLDLLLYDELILDTPALTIPHPRMMFRRFVMEPAAEIAPRLVHPQLGWPLAKLARHLALARNYLAVCGPPGMPPRALAEEVHIELPGKLLLNIPEVLFLQEPKTHVPAAKYRGSSSACISALTRHAARLSKTQLGEAGLAENHLVVSDFWLGETLITAEAFLTPLDKESVLSTWNEIVPGVLQPKLVVCVLPKKKSLSSKNETDPKAFPEAPCEFLLDDEQLDQWRAAAQRLFTSGAYGPWFMLDGRDPASVLMELIAAAKAMR